jgi:cell division protein FtsI (penicillin-binding protein 3)
VAAGGANDFLQQKGESRYARVIELSATRGRIADRSGDMLAVSTPVKSVWAIPEDARLTPAQARELAGLLEMDVRELNRRLASEKDFVFIKRQIPPDAAEKIAALNLPGIHQQREYRRYYPAGDVTAHMLGFTGVEDKRPGGHRAGLRRPARRQAGQPPRHQGSPRPHRRGRREHQAAAGRQGPHAGARRQGAVPGLHPPEAGAGRAQGQGRRRRRARRQDRRGAGAGQLPAYNPNNRVKLTGAQLRNRALTDVFEPGSTMKPFTVALALEKGRFRFDSQIQTAPGRLTIGNATIPTPIRTAC